MEISIKQQMLAVLAADVLTLIDFCFLPSLKQTAQVNAVTSYGF